MHSILHIPESVAGNAYTLSLAERQLGVHSRVVSYNRNPFGYGADRFLFKPKDGVLAQESKKWGLVAHALRHFDVIHYNFGRTILDPFVPRAIRGPARRYPKVINIAFDLYARATGMKDLPLMKRAGKVIFVTFQGNDGRQEDYVRSHFSIHHLLDTEKAAAADLMDAERRKRIAFFGRYADRIFALNPDILCVLPPRARFLPYTTIDLEEWKPAPLAKDADAPLRILHSHTSQLTKGTKYILDAVERLKGEGFCFEFEMVENMPHDKVKAIYEKADLLIDQLLYGWYGGLAVELMALGVPVIAYIREEDLKFIPPAMKGDLPIINANPYTIYEVLKSCLQMDRAGLRALGARSRTFVERWHDPIKIAAQLKGEAEAVLAERKKGRRSSFRKDGGDVRLA
ncbi:MAG: glycosyltransferase [Chloroflexi bacterium]|nr:glycosyltransferase [Chloroflexota bacterium]